MATPRRIGRRWLRRVRWTHRSGDGPFARHDLNSYCPGLGIQGRKENQHEAENLVQQAQAVAHEACASPLQAAQVRT